MKLQFPIFTTKISRSVPLAVLLGLSGAADAEVPNVFGPGDLLTASKLNSNFRSLESVIAVSQSYSVGNVESTITLDASAAPFELTLPRAEDVPGKRYYLSVVAASANAITVQPWGTAKVCGKSSVKLLGQFDGMTIQSDGTNWVSNDCLRTVTVTHASAGAVIYWQKPESWVTGIHHTAGGQYTLDFQVGVFSSPPDCSLASIDGGGRLCTPDGSPTTGGLAEVCFSTRGGGTFIDSATSITCVGFR